MKIDDINLRMAAIDFWGKSYLQHLSEYKDSSTIVARDLANDDLNIHFLKAASDISGGTMDFGGTQSMDVLTPLYEKFGVDTKTVSAYSDGESI